MTDTTTHHINESADKITLKTKLKRGTGTRDEDKYDLKVKGNDAEDVAETMATLQAAMQDHGLVDTTRAMQPGEDDA
jgi:hypothetical protein